MKKQGRSKPDVNVEDLYLQFLRAFYEDEDRPKSSRIARRLESELASRPDLAESIRGDELRSLLAELRGDYEDAIKNRQREIRRILELHGLSHGTTAWDYVVKTYDYRDVSDRIDILANLYAMAGDREEAVRLLEESRRFCTSHGIPFDGQDLLDEFSGQVREESDERDIGREMLDDVIKDVYRNFNQSSDQILIDENKGRRFAEEVLRRLPGDIQVSIKLVKSRLLSLRRRGEERGGLPRLRSRA